MTKKESKKKFKVVINENNTYTITSKQNFFNNLLSIIDVDADVIELDEELDNEYFISVNTGTIEFEPELSFLISEDEYNLFKHVKQDKTLSSFEKRAFFCVSIYSLFMREHRF